MYHELRKRGTSDYFEKKSLAFNFLSAVPFGLIADELFAWVQYGGGQEPAEPAIGEVESTQVASRCIRRNIPAISIDTVAGDPSRQRVGVPEMRQHHVGEACVVVVAAHHVFMIVLPRSLIGNNSQMVARPIHFGGHWAVDLHTRNGHLMYPL